MEAGLISAVVVAPWNTPSNVAATPAVPVVPFTPPDVIKVPEGNVIVPEECCWKSTVLFAKAAPPTKGVVCSFNTMAVAVEETTK